jgi:hypothetical protein
VVDKCRTFRNDNALSKLSHLPTNVPNAHVPISGIFAEQRNGGGGREKDLYNL